MSVVMGGTRCVVYSVISRRLEHPSVIDQVESIPSQGSQRKRHWVVVFFFHWVFLISCVLPIKAERDGGPYIF